MALTLPIYTVDAFTDKVFTGNPAAVCPLKDPLSDELCQKIAFELNLSQTCFVRLLKDGDDFASGTKFGLRWFTPTVEVPLCGHGTLSVAHILFNQYKNPNPVLTFESMRSGELRCVKNDDGSVQLDFPERKVEKLENSDSDFYTPLVKECVGELPVDSLWHAYESDCKKLFIVLDESVGREKFEAVKPNFDGMHKFDPTGKHSNAVLITMKGTIDNGCVDEKGTVYSFVSRFFCPLFGIPEDPVCGSMHCSLAPLWSVLLGGQKTFYARMCSQRGGLLKVALRDGRVQISGNAVTVISGQIAL